MPDLAGLQNIPPVIFYLIILWSTIWKGLALWRAVKYSQRNWYIAMLILNTLGILEITYLFFFAKKRFSIQELTSFSKK